MPTFDRLRFDDGLEESPRIRGSRISVIQIYEMHVLNGDTVTDIAQKYEALDTESVEQAIRYARSHPDEIREQATSELTKAIVERQGRAVAAA
ncbi:MAG: DUF433 domain-containing protein [Candidatus Nanohaloarchaea archaeon]